ncbi:hypothetical protein FRC11_007478, partial [Ceratobasidium sp. 423]
QRRWRVIVYVDSTSPRSIESSLEQFALTKSIGGTYEDTIEWLGSQMEQWLLVFDGADMPSHGLTKYFPKGDHGSIIVTTRWRCFARYAKGKGYALDVTRMGQEEALELLMKVAYQLKAATALLEAGAYIDYADVTFSKYKERLLIRKRETLERFTKLRDKLDDYSETVYTTLAMCYELLGTDARQMLGIPGHLHQWDHQDGFRDFKKGGSLDVHHAAAFSEVYYDKGLFEKSKHMRLQVLARERTYHGEAYPVTLRTMSLLATTCWELGQFNQAEELQRKVHDLCSKTLGPTHLETLGAKVKLVSTYSSMGQIEKANELLENILEDPSNLQRNQIVLGQLAQSCYNMLDYPNAEKIDILNIKVLEETLGEEQPQTLSAMSNLASTYAQLGRFNDAEMWDRRALEIQKRVLGAKHQETLQTMENLASTCADLGRFSEAESLGLEVLDSRKHVLNWQNARTRVGYGSEPFEVVPGAEAGDESK